MRERDSIGSTKPKVLTSATLAPVTRRNDVHFLPVIAWDFSSLAAKAPEPSIAKPTPRRYHPKSRLFTMRYAVRRGPGHIANSPKR